MAQPQKIYILDESTLRYDPCAMDNFKEQQVVLPSWIVEDFARHEREESIRGLVADAVGERLDYYRGKGFPPNGVPTDGGGVLQIDYRGIPKKLQKKFQEQIGDIAENQILFFAKCWENQKERNPSGLPVIVVTKNKLMREKSGAHGLTAQDYKTDRKISSLADLYSGSCEIEFPEAYRGLLTTLNHEKELPEGEVWKFVEKPNLFPNICCQFTVHGSNDGGLAIYDAERKVFRSVPWKKRDAERSERVVPRNAEQALFHAHAMNPNITLLTGVGKAGTGKTVMAVDAGYRQIASSSDSSDHATSRSYEGITVFRPNIEIGVKLGYLPGDVNEKFSEFMKPIIDSLRFILASEQGTRNSGARRPSYEGIGDRINRMMQDGLLEICPVNYIRGRNFNGRFVIVDEAQNFPPHIIKTVISRAGVGAKVVLVGDLEQIDDKDLDSVSNGLSHVVQKSKGWSAYAHEVMTVCERSDLAKFAADVL